ncbi:bifunctional DNA-directed RNA polymerase subunit beta [Striga asiatica]|uniref:Bifunctional DNA-directed RNA polymerase subunit beta n=1 Tax=Striga asiatica TaxID=4170 RepID=A0A5A7QFY4_STRAF|nr:bifunctional DNA-directed RNA polymerase subunit beta [Striga asiatica]
MTAPVEPSREKLGKRLMDYTGAKSMLYPDQAFLSQKSLTLVPSIGNTIGIRRPTTCSGDKSSTGDHTSRHPGPARSLPISVSAVFTGDASSLTAIRDFHFTPPISDATSDRRVRSSDQSCGFRPHLCLHSEPRRHAFTAATIQRPSPSPFSSRAYSRSDY